MKKPIIVALFVIAFALLLAKDARAQAFSGYTSIDYYAATNTVDAYSETDADFDATGEYQAYVILLVVDQNNTQIAVTTGRDYLDNGFVAVELLFSGTPDTTYTAKGIHKGYATQSDYDSVFPITFFTTMIGTFPTSRRRASTHRTTITS